MRNRLKHLSIILGVAVPSILFAAPPANDSFATPTILTGFPATASGSNVDATLENDEPLLDYPAEASVWFRWTAPTSGPVQIDTLDSDFDTVLAVWAGDELPDLSLIAMNDDFGGGWQSAIFIPVVSGVTYQIAVYGYSTDQGTIALRITNDTFSRISGTVTGPDETTPLAGIAIGAYRWNESQYWQYWQEISSGQSDADGHYTIHGLEAGTYRVRFADGNGDYSPEVFNNAAAWTPARILSFRPMPRSRASTHPWRSHRRSPEPSPGLMSPHPLKTFLRLPFDGMNPVGGIGRVRTTPPPMVPTPLADYCLAPIGSSSMIL
jgi:hypothetical protein